MKNIYTNKIIHLFIMFILAFLLLVPKTYANTETEEWDAAVDVNAYKSWTITLSSSVNPDTVNSDTVYVFDESNKKVKTEVNLGEADNIIIIEPPEDGYNTGAMYTLYVTNEVQDDEGLSLKNTISKSFLIESERIAEVKVKENIDTLEAEAIVESTIPEIVQSGSDGGAVTLSDDFGMSLNVGDIIKLEPSEEFPEGYARKIESIKEVNGVYEAQTSVPYLEDLVSSISLNESIEITADDIDPSSLDEGVVVNDFREYDRNVAGFVEGLEYVFDNYPLEYNQQILFLTGKIQLQNPRIDPKIEWNGLIPELDDVKFVFHATVVTQLSFSLDLNRPLIKPIPFKEVPINLGKFSTPIPQVPGLTVGGKIGGIIKTSAIGGFNASITNSTYTEVGIIKKGKNIRPVREFLTTNVISHTGSGGVEVKVGLRTSLYASYLTVEMVALNGDVGPYANLQFIKGTLHSSNESLSCYNSEIGVFGDLSVSFPPLKKVVGWRYSSYTLASYQLPLIFLNNCKSVQSIEFSDSSISIVSGEKSNIKVYRKVFDYSKGKNSSIFENITKDVTYKTNDSNVTIASNGRIHVKPLQQDKKVTVTATYNQDGKVFTTNLIVNVKQDPDLPDFPTGSNVMQDQYVNSYVIKNTSTQRKLLRLLIEGDYVIYDTNGNVKTFSRNIKNITLSKGERATVSFKESVPSLSYDDLTIEPTTTAALLNVYQLNHASSKFTNTTSQTANLKLTSGDYGYVIYNEDGSVHQYNYVSGRQNTIHVPANGYVIITSVEGTLLNIYAPLTSFTFEKYSRTALEIYDLAIDETVTIKNETTNNQKLKINGIGTFDYVIYENTSSQKVSSFYKDERNYSWDRTYTLRPDGSFIITNRTGKTKRIYAPTGKFSFEKNSTPALDTYSLKKGETFKVDNLTSRLQYVKLSGSSRGFFDYVKYSDFENNKVDSFEKDTLIYSWDRSNSVANGGSFIVTNANSDNVTIYAPSSLFSFSSHHSKALEEFTIKQNETLSIDNDTTRTQHVKIVGNKNSVYDYVKYSDQSKINVTSFEYRKQNYSWDSSHFISSNGQLEIRNISSEPMIIYAPNDKLNFTKSQSHILQVVNITSGQSVTFSNLTERTQSIKLRGTGEYDIVRYSDYSTKTVSSKNESVKPYSWDNTISMSKIGAVTITNSGNGEIIIYVPNTVVQLIE